MKWLTLLLSLCCALSMADANRYFLLVDEAPKFIQHLSPKDLEFTEDGVSLLRVPMDRVEEFAEWVHEELGGCGGYFDVTERIENGEPAFSLVLREARLNHVLKQRRFQSLKEPVSPIIFRADIAQLVAQADIERYWAFLTELSAFPDRSATTENGKKAAEFLKSRSEQIAENLLWFKTELVATGTSYGQPSVVATLPGRDPSLPHVVIGGHMDTFSNAKPGADDDGSGTSVVMEALQTIAKGHAKFRHTIDFVWYAAEERGLVGSGYVVRHFKDKNILVKSVIQFDMVGFNASEDDKDIFLITDNTNPALTARLKQIIELYTDAKVGETACGYACSDHAQWHRAGFSAVFPFETSFSNMNSTLHTGGDTMTLLDKHHTLRFIKTAVAFLAEEAVLEN